MSEKTSVILLHHSTGGRVWRGGVAEWIQAYNQKSGGSLSITERSFPDEEPYGWNNYPYDYWNIWVNHAGDVPYMNQPTLEMLTREYQVIVFKHCYPVVNIQADTGKGDAASEVKSLENYHLQYEALRKKMYEFPRTKFLVWTGAARVQCSEDEARRAQKFFAWVRDEWDRKGDNVFVWDFWSLETEGGLYLKPEYASGPKDSHPNEEFCRKVAPLLAQKIVDVVEGRGDEH